MKSNMGLAFRNRLRSAVPWAARHLMLSLGLVGVLAMVVFWIWFPGPFMEISGGWSLLLLIFAVDVVCGPALTLLLLHPGKSRKALWVDIGLIVLVQASALVYGVYSLSQARPVAIAFEVDRFRVVSYAELDTSHPEAIPNWVEVWNFSQPRFVGTRGAKDVEEKLESVDASLQGVEPGVRPHWWQDYALNVPQVKMRARPLEQLIALNPRASQSIQSQAAHASASPREGEVGLPSELVWLPVVGRRSMDWAALVDPHTGRVRGYVHADGFGG